MLSFQRSAIICIFTLFLGAATFAAGSSDVLSAGYSDLKVGATAQVEIKSLHPTQFNIGVDEMNGKRNKFEKKTPEELEAYLKAHPCPVVIGPGGIPYITDEQHRAEAALEAEGEEVLDHHHTASVLLENGKPSMEMKVIANYSDLTPEEFEKKMIEEHYTYLYDRGVLKPFNELPSKVDQMGDDPYRSLAGFLEDISWKLKKGVYFEQFEVAMWLRKTLGLSDKKVSASLKKKHRKKFLKDVAETMESSAAVSQPWYMKGEDCVKDKLKDVVQQN